jgi:hypothetical protein
MRAPKITPEHLLYLLAFLLALFLRTYQLGAGALSDAEAGWALQALGVARGETVSLGAQPAYIILTSQLFSILSASNFLARLYPAIAGSLLVWLPFFFHRWTGASLWLHRASLVMAFGLAIDPGLVALSRQAGSPVPALAFFLLALACLYERRMVLMGIFAGLAVLSGHAFLQGMLILGSAGSCIVWLKTLSFDLNPIHPMNRCHPRQYLPGRSWLPWLPSWARCWLRVHSSSPSHKGWVAWQVRSRPTWRPG